MLLSDVCLSVAYIGPKPRTYRPMKTKIGTEVAHVTRDSDTIFKVKGQLVADVLEQMEQKNEEYKSHLIHMRDNIISALDKLQAAVNGLKMTYIL